MTCVIFHRYCVDHVFIVEQRLTAEELGKSKWIKSVSKEKISTLRDLILRYDAWMQGGGTRMSIAEPLDWEKEEESECVCIH